MTVDDIFVLNVKSYFHDNEHCISSTPYRGGGSRVCRASCAVFYSDSKVPGAVFHSDTSPYRGGGSRVCRASCAVFHSDTKVRGAVFHSDTKVRGAVFYSDTRVRGAVFHSD